MCETSTTRLSFGSQYKFPLKLFEIANDGLLIKWTDDGKALIVEENDFEQNVMLLYPGFVQVEAFHNLRRLFRDYNFKFRVLRKRKPYGAKLEYRHPYFQRYSPTLIFRVKKKKRLHLLDGLNAASSPKYAKYTSSKLPPSPQHGASNSSQPLANDTAESTLSTDFYDCDESDFSPSSTPTVSSKHVPKLMFEDHRNTQKKTVQKKVKKSKKTSKVTACKNDPALFQLLQIYAKNELSESEFWEVVTKRCGRQFEGETWEEAMEFIDSIVNHEFSPLHFNDHLYELSLSEL